MTVQSSGQSPPLIVVVGSINMDLVARMVRLPLPGETVAGESFQTICGGKGANQAVAAARLGVRVAMIGRVGDDSFGTTLRQNLVADGIDTSQVLDTPGCSSGVALIGVEATGANAITVVPAANGRLSVNDIESCRATIAAATALIVQLETPLETVSAAIRIAKQHSVLTVLDPAPAPSGPLPQDLISVDIISPNQSEARSLTGIVVEDWRSAERAARQLQSLGANDVVLKLGELGAFVLSRDGIAEQVSALKSVVVDTTAAGDAFTAALTVARCQGQSLVQSAKYGCLAGTFACTRFGAQPAMPAREELERWSRTAAEG